MLDGRAKCSIVGAAEHRVLPGAHGVRAGDWRFADLTFAAGEFPEVTEAPVRLSLADQDASLADEDPDSHIDPASWRHVPRNVDLKSDCYGRKKFSGYCAAKVRAQIAREFN